jgi:predicted secreted hydrolase
VSPRRRALLLAALWPLSARAQDDPVRRGRALAFPRDHGAHPGSAIEWWYATGWLGQPEAPRLGFQITFFRSRTGLAADSPSRFAARHLLFAHAALTDLEAKQHQHSQRLVRWSGRTDSHERAAQHDADVRLARWHFRREAGATPRYVARVDGEFGFELQLTRTQEVLLQGDAGFSRKGPDDAQSSHYYSEPQLLANAQVTRQGRSQTASGRAWLDHEWSDALLHPDAVGWDWLGINLHDGSALTAFQLRRADGSMLWAGGSMRRPGQAARIFAASDLRFTATRHWRSAATGVLWPVQWWLDTPEGRFEVAAMLDAQELDNRASTGTLYWEGLSQLRDAQARVLGLGYLELTGYGQRLRLG